MTDRLRVDSRAGEATIERDGYGVPHVRGETAVAAWFGMGYTCAHDRMFQMDYDRRRAGGRWAEIAGPSAVGADVLARRLRLADAARADVAAMSPETGEAFGAYARCVSQALRDGVAPLPGRYPLEPWEPWHSVAMFKVRHVLMGQWQHKLAEAVLLARIGPDAFGRLSARPPLGSPLSVPPGERLSRLVADALGDITGHLGFLAETEPGSNAWAVSGRRTAHGGAVICNDSHRALDTPNVYWQVRVTCPDFDVAGATFPGLPGFPHFGFNGSVAWAITHAYGDSQDLYIERFDGSRYLTEDGWQDAAVRTEQIAVRGGGTTQTQVWTTRHGPVVHGDPAKDGLALALKYTATHRPDRGFECLLPMLKARDVAELAAAQAGWVDPVNNLVCADADGKIAYQCRGEIPVRSSAAHRRLPVPGWDGECEWVGTVPFGDLPRAIDPDAGFVMTANNAIVDGDEPYISATFAQPFRAERLRSLLAGSGTLSVDELAGMQADTVSWAAREWGRLLGGLGPFGGPAEAARVLLADWDGDLGAGSAPALLYGCFVRCLADSLYRPLLGGAAWGWVAAGTLAPTLGMVRRWLANDTWELLGGPVPPGSGSGSGPGPGSGSGSGSGSRSGGERGERVLAFVPGALADAWAAAVRHGGSDPARWRWGDVHQAVRAHPLESGGERAVAMALASVPMGGDADTLQAAGYGWAQDRPFTVTSLSVYRQVVDLADAATASYVIPGGASGDPQSPHFADQLAVWGKHRRIPMYAAT